MKKEINKIRKQIVWKIKCHNWCYDCCWVIMFTKEEEILMKKELRKQWIKKPPNWKWDEMCEYLTSEWKCSVYNQRPIICRIFWIVDNPRTICIKLENVKLMKESFEMKKYWVRVIKKGLMNKNWMNILNNLDKNMEIKT